MEMQSTVIKKILTKIDSSFVPEEETSSEQQINSPTFVESIDNAKKHQNHTKTKK